MECRLGRWDGRIDPGVWPRGELLLAIDNAGPRIERGLLGKGDEPIGFGSAWDEERPERHADERETGRDASRDLEASSLALSARQRAELTHIAEVIE